MGLIMIAISILFVIVLTKLANNYNFLKKLRNLKTVTKYILGVLCLSGGPLLLTFFCIWIVRSNDTNTNKFDREINQFILNYGQLRPYVKGAKDNIIYVGSYVCEYEGKLCYLSKFLSIYAKNLPRSIESQYPIIETRQIEQDRYCQFPIKQKYSNIAKQTIICAVLKHIEEHYAEDKIFFDKSMPIGMVGVDMKKAWDLFN